MKHFMIALIAVLALTACKKNNIGGDVTIAAFPKHHSVPIKGATIYIKFDAKDLPSDPTNNYDLKIVGESNEEHVHIEGLRYGKYYLYAVGFDSTIMAPVMGGTPLKIQWKERKNETDIDIPVVE
ncbi:hypothetical protein BH09BAC5_BH09BAC5_13910 [soil metagenome]